MRKHGIGMLSYQQLQDEFSSSLKKDYNENKDESPLSTILRSSINFIEWTYYPRYFIYLITSFGFVVFLYAFKDSFSLALLTALGWIIITSVIFYLFAGVPILKHIKDLKNNVLLVAEDCKGANFTADDAVAMLKNIKNKEDIKSELLLQKYYDYVSPRFLDDTQKDKYSSPISRMLCYQLINHSSKIPITDKETNVLAALLLRIGKKSYADHNTKLNRINSIVKDGIQKNLTEVEVKSILEQVDLTKALLKRALNEVESIYTKFDEINKNSN